MSQTFTLADVQTHNKPDNLWIVVDGDVYDLTKFGDEHPGGKKILQRVAGKDASKQFWKYHNAHILEKYRSRLRVGSLDTKAVGNAPPTPPATPPSGAQAPAPVPTEGDTDKGRKGSTPSSKVPINEAPAPTEEDIAQGSKGSTPSSKGGPINEAPVPTEEDVSKAGKEKERPKWTSAGAYGPAPNPGDADAGKGAKQGGDWSSVGAYGPAPKPTEQDKKLVKELIEKPTLYGKALPEPKPLKSKL